MSNFYQYGNIKTLEYIQLGKGPLWEKMFWDYMNGEIDISLFRDYIQEDFDKFNTDPKYTEWVIKNITTFLEYTHTDDLILYCDSGAITIFKTKEHITDDDPNLPFPPIHTSEPLWKCIWSRWHTDNDTEHQNIKLNNV